MTSVKEAFDKHNELLDLAALNATIARAYAQDAEIAACVSESALIDCQLHLERVRENVATLRALVTTNRDQVDEVVRNVDDE